MKGIRECNFSSLSNLKITNSSKIMLKINFKYYFNNPKFYGGLVLLLMCNTCEPFWFLCYYDNLFCIKDESYKGQLS